MGGLLPERTNRFEGDPRSHRRLRENHCHRLVGEGLVTARKRAAGLTPLFEVLCVVDMRLVFSMGHKQAVLSDLGAIRI